MLNLDTTGIETMETRDAIHVASALLDKFKQAGSIYMPFHMKAIDKDNTLNLTVYFVVQMFRNDEEKSTEYYMGSYSRAVDYSCINGVNLKKCTLSEFRAEVDFIKMFNTRTNG